MRLILKCTILIIMLALGLSCSSDAPNQSSIKVVEGENGEIFIVDLTGKHWEVSNGIKYGLNPEEYQFGLGPDVIRPIMNPRMIEPGHPEYPNDDDTFLVMGTTLNGETRAYSIDVMAFVEIANETFGDTHVTIGY